MSPPMIATLPCQAVVRCAAAHGIAAEAICATAGIDASILGDSEARLPISAYYALLERLSDALHDPHIGLTLPHHATADSYGLLGFLFMSSATVGQAFARMLAYQRLVADPAISMEVNAGRATVGYTLWGPTRAGHDHVADAFAAETVLGFQMLCGPGVLDDFTLQLTRAATDPAPYLESLGVTPTFDAPELELSFDAALLDLPVAKADPALAQMLDQQAQIMLRLLPPRPSGTAAYAERVRAVVMALLPDGVPRIELVAKQLGQSGRSLQRHLQDEGTSLKELIDTLRRELSQKELRRGASTAEIALLLGFSETSAFNRAFKRWTGTSPVRWREAAAR